MMILNKPFCQENNISFFFISIHSSSQHCNTFSSTILGFSWNIYGVIWSLMQQWLQLAREYLYFSPCISIKSFNRTFKRHLIKTIDPWSGGDGDVLESSVDKCLFQIFKSKPSRCYLISDGPYISWLLFAFLN